MDFFNSLNEVAKNRNNFKKLEDHQRDVDAQREELHQRHKPSEAEIQAAKSIGERIIDVVDIMDNHSENVAENVETAVDPLSSLTTLLTFFGGNYILGKKSTAKILDKISDIKSKAVKSLDGKLLTDKIKESQSGYGKYFSSNGLVRKSEIERIKDPALKAKARKFFAKVRKETKPLNSKIWRNHGLIALGAVGVFIISTIFEAKLQTDSSKIARYQARKELNNPNAFVNYTPEQIEEAQKELKEHPELLKEKKKSKLKSGMIRSIYGILRDRKAYKKDKSARSDDSQKINRELSPKELIQAQKDKEIIQRTVRLINNEAEKYSENMEVTANVIMNTTPLLGATVGLVTSWILNKAGVIDKFVDNTVKKYGTEEAKKVLDEYRAIKKPDFFSKKYTKFVGELYSVNEEAANSAVKKNKFSQTTRQFLTSVMAHRQGRNWFLGIAGGVVSGLAGMLIALKLQKSSARAGRYTAKRELEKDPKNFIGYSEEDFKEVQNIKNTSKKPSTIKEYIAFIPTVLKQYYAYNKFRKTEYKEKQVLNEILRKQEVTDEQMKDAKNLQRKIFNTFEKIDDNSQIYSESMEAATEIAQPFVWYGGLLAAFSPAIYGAIQFKRGKITGAKIIQKITDKLSSGSNIMQKKWFRTYLSNVEKNIGNKLENTEVIAKPFGALFKGIDFEKEPVLNIAAKILENANIGVEDFAKLSDDKQKKVLLGLWDSLYRMQDSLFSPISEQKIKSLMNLVDNLSYNVESPIERVNIIKFMINPDSVTDMVDYNKYKAIVGESAEMITDSFKSLERFDDMANMAKGRMNDLIKMLKSEFKLVDGENAFIDIKTLEILKQILKVDKLKDASITLYKTTDEKLYIKPEDFPKVIKQAAEKIKKMDTPSALKIVLEQKNLTPKKVLASFKAKVEKMTDEEFKDFAESKRIRSMDKNTMLQIIPKLEKIMDNLPQEELDKIFSRILKEISEHPDELIRLMQKNDWLSLFITPGMKNAMITAGVSWVALSIAVSWMIEQWLADMQLKAGRLGVMKAMESLSDPRYYANIEVDKPKAVEQPKVETHTSLNSNLLDKFKK